jgi:predicted RNase H-like nuclease (RuvC/YqgF family)
MIAEISFSGLLPTIISTLFGGGIVAIIATLYKVRPEAGQIVVTAAQGALIVQTGVIENLKKEIARLHEEIAELKKQHDEEIEELREVNKGLREELSHIRTNQNRHDKEIRGHDKDIKGHDRDIKRNQ